MKIKLATTVSLSLLATACGKESDVPGYDALVHQVQRQSVGVDADQWVEMINLSGQWERTGLIFGYVDDYDECIKAIAGLKRANPVREYRCAPANEKN